MNRWELAGRTVAITGAGGGLGSNLAQALRAKGCNLALLDIDAARVEPLADQLGGPQHAKVWQADVCDLGSLEAAFAAVAAHFGRIDVVVANAGVTVIESVAAGDPVAFERLVDINLTGVWRTYRAAIPHVRKQRGYLLGVSSMAAFVHSPLQSGYTASKAGVWALCDSTRLEVRHLGVDVGSVHPTFFQTPMMDNVFTDPAGLRLWGGNTKGLWKMVSRDSVIEDIVSGIEHRRKMVVCPKRNTFLARIPGLVHPVIDRIGFPGRTVPDAIDLTTRS